MEALLDALERWVEERALLAAPAPSLREALEAALNEADLSEVVLARIDCLQTRLAEDPEPSYCRCRHGDQPAMGHLETTEGGW